MREKVMGKLGESFSSLNLGIIEPGSDKNRAILDVIKLNQQRNNLILEGLIGFSMDSSPVILSPIQNFEMEKLNNMRISFLIQNEENGEYEDVFQKVDSWLGDGGYFSEVKRIDFLTEVFGER